MANSGEYGGLELIIFVVIAFGLPIYGGDATQWLKY